ncbi:hypothetical protein [Streptomyces albofaciens]|uniref:hypothetical protein n=1 Tax=Streptomyces albofaciens TaxID=66866 RepID=UPI00142EC79B|nr:hypothetical protein [Streptomyces albofaciens]
MTRTEGPRANRQLTSGGVVEIQVAVVRAVRDGGQEEAYLGQAEMRGDVGRKGDLIATGGGRW